MNKIIRSKFILIISVLLVLNITLVCTAIFLSNQHKNYRVDYSLTRESNVLGDTRTATKITKPTKVPVKAPSPKNTNNPNSVNTLASDLTSKQIIAFNKSAKLVDDVINTNFKNGLHNLKGNNVLGDSQPETIASIYNQSQLLKEEKAEYVAQLLCDANEILSNKQRDDLDNWAAFRTCTAGAHVIMANYHTRRYELTGSLIEKEWAGVHYYLMGTKIDILTTGSEYDTISKTIGSNTASLPDNLKKSVFVAFYPLKSYKLRDTRTASVYLADSSPGFGISFGLGKTLQTLPKIYCTSIELPYTPGKGCKEINLWQRIQQIEAAAASKIATEWMFNANGKVKSYYANNPNIIDADHKSNTNFDPEHGVGYYDLFKRRTSSKVSHSYPIKSGNFTWQMLGMADAARIATSNINDQYAKIYNFGITAGGYLFAFDRNNPKANYGTTNPYGYTVRGLNSNLCDGTLNLEARDPLAICTGGKYEWFENRDSSYPKEWPPEITGLAYLGQHFAGGLSTTSWSNQLPEAYTNNALNVYYAYKATTTKDGISYFDYNNGGYNEQLIRRMFPDYISDICSDKLSPDMKAKIKFYKTPSGRVVSSWGEIPAELAPTFVPSLAHLISQSDWSKAQELLTDVNKLLIILKNQPVTAQESTCAGGNWIGKSELGRQSWQYNNLLLGYYLFRRIPIPSFTDSSKQSEVRLDKIQDLDIGLKIDYGPGTISDGIAWDEWKAYNLSSVLPKEIPKFDTRTVFKDPNGVYYDSVILGNKYWNRYSSNYNDFSKKYTDFPWLPQGGGKLTSAFPPEFTGMDSRVVFQDEKGVYTESVVKGTQAWNRRIPTWFKPEAWQKIDLIKAGVPQKVLPIDTRTTYFLQNEKKTIDIWFKGNIIYYRTIGKNSVISPWNQISTKTFKLPPGALGGIESIATWQEPNGRWAQGITKGDKAWMRYGR